MSDQLNITFDATMTIRERLRSGQFVVLLEYRPPTADQPFKLASKPGLELAEYVRSDDRILGLAVTHNYGTSPDHPLDKTVGQLKEHCAKELLVYVTGRGLDGHAYRQLLATLKSQGISSLAAVSGVGGEQHPRDAHGRPVCTPGAYLDSCLQVRTILSEYPETFTGATVNPFKYNISDVFLQYAKLVKKLNSGAQFIVAQAGWDMRKYQELQWYLQSRGLDDPCLARLYMVRPGEVPGIIDGEQSGIVISRELGAQIQRESQLGDVQALTAQIRRIALQAAGCKHLGFSGIQVAGLADGRTARTVMERIFEALDEFSDYNAWLAAWQDFHNRVEMAPYPHRYYAYKNLLEPDLPAWERERSANTSFSIPEPAGADKFRFSLGRLLGLQRGRGPLDRLLRRMISQAPMEHQWQLGKTLMLSAAQCPKGLEEGACGGSRPDGTCEFGHTPCFFHRVLALANWQNDLEKLEQADEPR